MTKRVNSVLFCKPQLERLKKNKCLLAETALLVSLRLICLNCFTKRDSEKKIDPHLIHSEPVR